MNEAALFKNPQSYGALDNSSLQNVANDDEDPEQSEQLRSTTPLVEEAPEANQPYQTINAANYNEDLEYIW